MDTYIVLVFHTVSMYPCIVMHHKCFINKKIKTKHTGTIRLSVVIKIYNNILHNLNYTIKCSTNNNTISYTRAKKLMYKYYQDLCQKKLILFSHWRLQTELILTIIIVYNSVILFSQCN